MSEKVFYKGHWRKVRCACTDTWENIISKKGKRQKCFPDDAGERFKDPCPVCDYYYWYETKWEAHDEE